VYQGQLSLPSVNVTVISKNGSIIISKL
jgi:hypothetical protein